MTQAQHLATKDFSHVKTVDGFAGEINAAWHRAVQGIIEVGLLCLRANDELSRNELNDLKARLHMSDGTFSKLKKIAEDKKIASSKYWSQLPSSYGTLYEITHLSNDEFETAVKDGVIKPSMERSDVAALRLTSSKAVSQKDSGLKNTRTLLRITTNSGSVSKAGIEALESAVAKLVKFKSLSIEPTSLYEQITSKSK